MNEDFIDLNYSLDTTLKKKISFLIRRKLVYNTIKEHPNRDNILDPPMFKRKYGLDLNNNDLCRHWQTSKEDRTINNITNKYSSFYTQSPYTIRYGLDGNEHDVTFIFFNHFVNSLGKVVIRRGININIIFGDHYPNKQKRICISKDNIVVKKISEIDISRNNIEFQLKTNELKSSFTNNTNKNNNSNKNNNINKKIVSKPTSPITINNSLETIHIILSLTSSIKYLPSILDNIKRQDLLGNTIKLHIIYKNPKLKSTLHRFTTYKNNTLNILFIKYPFTNIEYIRDTLIPNYNSPFVILLEDNQINISINWLYNLWKIKQENALICYNGKVFDIENNFERSLISKNDIDNNNKLNIKTYDYGELEGGIIDTRLFKKGGKIWDISKLPIANFENKTIRNIWVSYILNMEKWSIKRSFIAFKSPQQKTHSREINIQNNFYNSLQKFKVQSNYQLMLNQFDFINSKINELSSSISNLKKEKEVEINNKLKLEKELQQIEINKKKELETKKKIENEVKQIELEKHKSLEIKKKLEKELQQLELDKKKSIEIKQTIEKELKKIEFEKKNSVDNKFKLLKEVEKIEKEKQKSIDIKKILEKELKNIELDKEKHEQNKIKSLDELGKIEYNKYKLEIELKQIELEKNKGLEHKHKLELELRQLELNKIEFNKHKHSEIKIKNLKKKTKLEMELHELEMDKKKRIENKLKLEKDLKQLETDKQSKLENKYKIEKEINKLEEFKQKGLEDKKKAEKELLKIENTNSIFLKNKIKLEQELQSIQQKTEKSRETEQQIKKEVDLIEQHKHKSLDTKKKLEEELENLELEKTKSLEMKSKILNEVKKIEQEKIKSVETKNKIEIELKKIEQEKNKILHTKQLLINEVNKIEINKTDNYDKKLKLEDELNKIEVEKTKSILNKEKLEEELKKIELEKKISLINKEKLEEELKKKNEDNLKVQEKKNILEKELNNIENETKKRLENKLKLEETLKGLELEKNKSIENKLKIETELKEINQEKVKSIEEKERVEVEVKEINQEKVKSIEEKERVEVEVKEINQEKVKSIEEKERVEVEVKEINLEKVKSIEEKERVEVEVKEINQEKVKSIEIEVNEINQDNNSISKNQISVLSKGECYILDIVNTKQTSIMYDAKLIDINTSTLLFIKNYSLNEMKHIVKSINPKIHIVLLDYGVIGETSQINHFVSERREISRITSLKDLHTTLIYLNDNQESRKLINNLYIDQVDWMTSSNDNNDNINNSLDIKYNSKILVIGRKLHFIKGYFPRDMYTFVDYYEVTNSNLLKHIDFSKYDIIWFEFASSILKYINHIPKDKKIIVRIHRYEFFTNDFLHYNWDRVHKIVVINKDFLNIPTLYDNARQSIDNIKSYVKNTKDTFSIDKILKNTFFTSFFLNKQKVDLLSNKISNKLICLPNRIHNKKQLSLIRKNQKYFDIGMIGYDRHVKGLDRALLLLGTLITHNPKYRLHLIGESNLEFKPLLEKYKDNIIIYPHTSKVEDFIDFYDNIGIILSTSYIEGSHQAIIESIVAGKFPIILEWFFGNPRNQYPEVYSNIVECKDRIIQIEKEAIPLDMYRDKYILGKEKLNNKELVLFKEVNEMKTLNFYRNKDLTNENMPHIWNNIDTMNNHLSQYKSILFICGDYPGYGGAATNCYELQKYFSKTHKTYSVFYLFPNDTNLPKIWKTNDYQIVKYTELNETLKNLSFEPDLIILKSFISINLKSMFKCPIYYFIGGIYKNNLNKNYLDLNTRRDHDEFINQKVLKQIKNSDKSFCNSSHTQKVLDDIYGIKTSLFYGSFIAFYKQDKIYDVNFESRQYVYGLVMSNFERPIKNVEKSIEFLKDKKNVILIGKNSGKYLRDGWTCFDLMSRDKLMGYFGKIKYLVQDSHYESCSNVMVEGWMRGCMSHIETRQEILLPFKEAKNNLYTKLLNDKIDLPKLKDDSKYNNLKKILFYKSDNFIYNNLYKYHNIDKGTINIFLFSHLITTINDTFQEDNNNFGLIKNKIKKHIETTALDIPFIYLEEILNIFFDRKDVRNFIETFSEYNKYYTYLTFQVKSNKLYFFYQFNEILVVPVNASIKEINKLIEICNKKKYTKMLFAVDHKNNITNIDNSKLKLIYKDLIASFYKHNIIIDISLVNNLSYQLVDNYRYILFEGYPKIILNFLCKLDNIYNYIKNKKFIFIPSHNGAHHIFKLKSSIEQLLIKISQQMGIILNINEFKNQFVIILKKIDSVENFVGQCQLGLLNNINSGKKCIDYLKSFDNRYIEYLPFYNNDILLSKECFFIKNNMDINKKTIVFFISWPHESANSPYIRPSYSKEHYHMSLERIFYKKFIHSILPYLKDNYNIIFKGHPGEYFVYNDDVYFKTPFYPNDPKKLQNGILNDNFRFLQNKSFKLIDQCYGEEVLKYSNIGIICYPSSLLSINYYYDLPIIHISHKKNKREDWFTMDSQIKNKNRSYYKLNNIFKYTSILYGECVYIEDLMTNTKNKLKKLIEKDYKSSYKYFSNHPLMGNLTDNNVSILTNLIKNLYDEDTPHI